MCIIIRKVESVCVCLREKKKMKIGKSNGIEKEKAR